MPNIFGTLNGPGARNIYGPLDESVANVDEWGGDNSGSASSTAAVQRAIDALIANGGGRVVFGPGTYVIGSVWANNAISFVGAGMDATTLLSDGVGAEFGYLWFNSGSEQPQPDDVIEGATSGATAVVIVDDVETGTYGGANATGRLYCKTLTGAFTAGENIDIQGGTANALTSTSTWQAPVLLIAGDQSQGDTSPTVQRTTFGGGVQDLTIQADNALFGTDQVAASRCSSWLKAVPVTSGEQESGGETPGIDTVYFETATTAIRGWVWRMGSSGGDWSNGTGTGTGTLYLDFVEGVSATQEASDRTYPGPTTTLTPGETINFYDEQSRALVASATVGTQANAYDRDIIGIDCSAQAYGFGYSIERARLKGLHFGIVTAQDERSMNVQHHYIEACTAGLYILKNHPALEFGLIQYCLFGVSGQDIFDLVWTNARVYSSLYGIRAYSVRPGLGTNSGRWTISNSTFYNRFYDLVCLGRAQFSNNRHVVGHGSVRACVYVQADQAAFHQGGLINNCQFDFSDSGDDPAIAYIWTGTGRVNITNCAFKILGPPSGEQSRAGILCKNTVAHVDYLNISNNQFIIAGETIPIRVQVAELSGEGASNSFSCFRSNFNGNSFIGYTYPAAGVGRPMMLVFSAGAGEHPVAGMTVTGVTSTATSKIIDVLPWRFGVIGSSNLRGILIVDTVSGTYTAGGESLTWGTSGTGTLSSGGAIPGNPMIHINGSQYGNTIMNNMLGEDSAASIQGAFLVTEDTNDYIKGNHMRNGQVIITNDDSTVRTTYTDNEMA